MTLLPRLIVLGNIMTRKYMVIIFFLFIDFLNPCRVVLAMSNEGDANLMEKIIKISEYGELRDVLFVEKELGVNFFLSRDNLNYSKIGEVSSVVSFSLTPDKPVGKGVEFRYRIAVEGHRQASSASEQVDIATIQFVNTGREDGFCVRPSVLRGKLPDAEPRIIHGTNPPATNMYVYTVKISDHYKTLLMVTGGALSIYSETCATVITIQQIAIN